MSKVIRVVQVFGRMDRGGAETMIMNLYRAIDRSRIQFDFIVHTQDKCAFDDEIRQLGGKVYCVPQFNGRNITQYVSLWNSILEEHTEWKIIHGHVRSTASIYLSIAKGKGLFTIAHSHNTSTERGVSGFTKRIFQYPIRYIADCYMACSSNAGEWLFGKKVCNSERFYILHNAINEKKYLYSKEIRVRIREEMGVSDALVFGNVSRFHPQKNHAFLLDVFAEIRSREDKAVLLLVGDGELRDALKTKVKKLNLEDSVVFMGIRPDVEQILQAIDAVVFPSLYEGLPVSIIEAQAAGVPCLLSDTISKECKITNCVCFQSLDRSVEDWATQAIELAQRGHIDTVSFIRESFYSVERNADWLTNFYESIDKERKR